MPPSGSLTNTHTQDSMQVGRPTVSLRTSILACLGLCCLLNTDRQISGLSAVLSQSAVDIGAISDISALCIYVLSALIWLFVCKHLGKDGAARLVMGRVGFISALVCGLASSAAKLISTVAAYFDLPVPLVLIAELIWPAGSSLLFVFLFACGSAELAKRPVLIPIAFMVNSALFFMLSSFDGLIPASVAAFLPFASSICYIVLARELVHSEHREGARPVPSLQSARTQAAVCIAVVLVFDLVFRFVLLYEINDTKYLYLGMFLAATAAAFILGFLGRTDFLFQLIAILAILGLIAYAYISGAYLTSAVLIFAGLASTKIFLYVAVCAAGGSCAFDTMGAICILKALIQLMRIIATSFQGTFLLHFPLDAPSTQFFFLSVISISLVSCGVVALRGARIYLFGWIETAAVEADEDPGSAVSDSAPPPDTSEKLILQCAAVARTYALTRREETVLVLLAQDLSVKEIAEISCLSVSTVKSHVSHIYQKLDIHSRSEACAIVEQA